MFSPTREIWISIGMGFGTLFLFLGYFANCFISESVIYSISLEYSGIDKHGGYMGMAAQMISFGLMNAFAPAIVAVFSAKRSIQLTGVTFALFFLGFVSFHEWYYYISQIVCGFGYAVFNVAEGIYISEHSSQDTIEIVTSIETTISHGGQLFSGCLLAVMYKYGSISTNDVLKAGFSMDHITIMYISFAITVAIGIVIFQILPSKPDLDSYAYLQYDQEEEEEGIWEQIRSVPYMLFHTRMILLVPLSVYQGFFSIFFLSVYPTAFTFDLNLQQNHDLMWIYCCFIGIGVIFGGLLLAAASSFSYRFTLTWSMSCHALLVVPTLAIIVYITPEWAFVQPVDSGATNADGLMYVIVIAFFVGVCDCLITTLRSVVCQTVVPGHRMAAFSVTRMTQAFSSAVALLLSPKISVLYWCLILTTLLVTACVFVYAVIYLAYREECKGAEIIPSANGAVVHIEAVNHSGNGSPATRHSSPQKDMFSPTREIWISIGMGFGTLFLFLGYFANCFISESVIYSISLEYSGIDKHGGYMGMAAQMISFGLMNAFAPAIVAVFSAKRSIQLTGVTFALFFLGFVSFHEWYYYISQIVCGFGYAVFNVAEGIYISEHCSQDTIEIVTSIETTISHGGQLFSGCLLAVMYKYGSISTNDVLKAGFSMDHITIMYISFAITVAIGIVIFQILPSKPDLDSYAYLQYDQEEEEEGIWEQIRSVPYMLFHTRMILLVPLSVYQGFSQFSFSRFTLLRSPSI